MIGGGDVTGLGGPQRATPLLRATRLGTILGLCHLHLKVESVNPTGSHKNRAARLLVERALTDGAGVVTVGSCGNLGVAVSAACAARGLRCRVVVPARYTGARTREMVELGAGVERAAGGYEDAVEASRNAARTNGWFDANPSGPAAGLFLDAYAAMAVEIVGALPDVSSVWVPAGNGTTAAGVALGLPPEVAVCAVGAPATPP